MEKEEEEEDKGKNRRKWRQEEGRRAEKVFGAEFSRKK